MVGWVDFIHNETDINAGYLVFLQESQISISHFVTGDDDAILRACNAVRSLGSRRNGRDGGIFPIRGNSH